MASRFLVPFGGHRGLVSPGDPFLDLHREMNRLFDDVYRGMGGSEGEPGGVLTAPRLDVHETENGLEISAELPGVSQDDIDLRVEGDMLTIRGEKRKERKDEAARIVERSYGSFQRSIQLPFTPDPDQIEADCDNGVLSIRLPRSVEQDRSRRIRIGGGRAREAGKRTIEGQAASSGEQPAIGRGWEGGEERGQSDLPEEQEKRGQGAPA